MRQRISIILFKLLLFIRENREKKNSVSRISQPLPVTYLTKIQKKLKCTLTYIHIITYNRNTTTTTNNNNTKKKHALVDIST